MSMRLGPGEVVDLSQVVSTKQRLGEVYRCNRRVHDITQIDVCTRTGLPQSVISDFETNGVVSFNVFYMASCGLHVPAWKILEKAQDPENFDGNKPIKSLII